MCSKSDHRPKKKPFTTQQIVTKLINCMCEKHSRVNQLLVLRRGNEKKVKKKKKSGRVKYEWENNRVIGKSYTHTHTD